MSVIGGAFEYIGYQFVAVLAVHIARAVAAVVAEVNRYVAFRRGGCGRARFRVQAACSHHPVIGRSVVYRGLGGIKTKVAAVWAATQYKRR